MATPSSVFSDITENETGPRKMNGTVGGKPKPKFALQDRSNVVLKKASSRIGTPRKAPGAGHFSLTISSKGKQENPHRAAKPSKLFGEENRKSKSFCEVDREATNYDNALPKDLPAEQEALVAVDSVTVNEDEEFPAPEKLNIPLESDFDYYSTIPSPSDKPSRIIHKECFAEGSGGPSDAVLSYPFDDIIHDPTRCMSPVVIHPMAFGVFVERSGTARDINF